MQYIIPIIVLGLIIFVHEFGHYIVAKISGIMVEEFSLGMGPAILKHKWGETLYSLRAIPFGGYCKMAGLSETIDESDTLIVEESKRFDNKSILVRGAVLFAGSGMNFILAAVLFSFIFIGFGTANDFTTDVGGVIEGSPAVLAGIQEDDKIVKIDDKPVEKWSQMVEIIHKNPDKKLKLTVIRESSTLEISIIPRYDADAQAALIGIHPKNPIWQPMGFIPGIGKGIHKTFELTVLMLQGFGQLVTGRMSADSVSGPIGIMHIIGQSARFGFIYLAEITAFISINLGLLNLMPIPALDGSRILFLFVEALRGKPLKQSKENMVHFIGFMFLLTFLLLVTYRDILKIFG